MCKSRLPNSIRVSCYQWPTPICGQAGCSPLSWLLSIVSIEVGFLGSVCIKISKGAVVAGEFFPRAFQVFSIEHRLFFIIRRVFL